MPETKPFDMDRAKRIAESRIPPAVPPWEADEAGNVIFEALEEIGRLSGAIERIAPDVHLILSDHYSGRNEEYRAALPAYARLTVIFEEEDGETHDARIRDVDGIVAAALSPPKDDE